MIHNNFHSVPPLNFVVKLKFLSTSFWVEKTTATLEILLIRKILGRITKFDIELIAKNIERYF